MRQDSRSKRGGRSWFSPGAQACVSRVEPRTEIAAAHQQILDELSLIEAQFTGPYLAGQLSIADFTVFPHMRLLKRVDERQPGKGITEDRLPSKLTAWTKRIEALPYYEKTTPPHWKG